MASDKIVEISNTNFHDEVLHSATPILLDFWAAWCGPCRMVAPVLDELAEQLAGKVRFGKVNVDDNQELANEYQVSSIPTFILFADGEAKGRMMGAMPKSAFERFLDQHA